MKFDIVIAGGGFAGAYCARKLGSLLGKAEGPRRVALLAESNVLVFQPMLAEVAGSALEPTDVVNPLRLFCRNATVLQGSIQKIDWANRELVVDGGRFTRNRTIGFAQLVLALGSVTNLEMTPGMAEYGRPLKYVADALRLRAALINRLEEANLAEDPTVRAHLLTYVIVGGGFTGVEAAGQIFDLVKQASKFYPDLAATPPRILLVHAGAELLPEIGENLGRYAREVLQRRGVEVMLNTRVASVTASEVFFTNGASVCAHTVVTTIGNTANPVTAELARELKLETIKGRIVVDGTMRVPGQESLWAIGDCAAVPWNDRGQAKRCPPTAQFAVRQGKQLAANLVASLRGGALKPFTYRYLGQLAAIGEHEAVAEVYGRHFRGFLAWWMWRTIYLAKLPGLSRRLRVVIDWTYDVFFPRDISLLVPAPDDLVRPVHLEPGELLFEKGGQCRAMFYVRRGAISVGSAGGGSRDFPEGTVIDNDVANGDGFWSANATAKAPTDLIVFRSRAYELLRHELKLIPRARPAPAPKSPGEG